MNFTNSSNTRTRNAFVAGAALCVVAVVYGCGDSEEAPLPPTPTVDASPDATANASDGGGDGGRGLENTGQSCMAPTDCYGGIDAGALKGAVQCLNRVTGGYCTHLCQTDTDCCAVTGECPTGIKQVCAPFESTGLKMCFLSCESSDLRAAPDAGPDAGALGDTAYCQTYASTEFICRSSGGGAPRKVCVPGGAGDGGQPDSGRDGGDAGPSDAGDGGG